MRILKYSAIILLAASATGSLQAQRPDSDLQSKAREALRQAETQADTQPVAPEKIAPAPPKKMKVVPPSTPATISDADAKAREQLRQAELDAATPTVSKKSKAEMDRAEHLRQLEAARAKKEAAQVTSPVVTVPAVTAPRAGGLSPDAEAKARESMRKTLADLDTQQKSTTAASSAPQKYTAPSGGWDQTPGAVTPTPAPAPVVVTPTPAVAPAPPVVSAPPVVKTKPKASVPPPSATKPAFDPGVTATVTAPPPPPSAPLVGGSKDARLADLLNRYKMDQITPADYHTQKAKILAEP